MIRTITSTPQYGRRRPDCTVCLYLKVVPPQPAEWSVQASDQKGSLFACGEHEVVAEKTMGSGTTLMQTMHREGLIS